MNRRDRLIWLVGLSSFILMCAPCPVGSAIIPRTLFDSPPTEVASETSINYACQAAWGHTRNLFDEPQAMCVLAAASNSNQFFIVDAVQGLITYFGTMANAQGVREISFIKQVGNYYGSGPFQFKNPTSITISHHDFTCMQDLFILDSGNNRIQRLVVNTCSEQITDQGYIYDAGNNHGYGDLNNAQAIDYCDLPGGTTDLLLVADTGNHRILFLDPANGAVLASIGGNGCGRGINEFCFPSGIAGTRVNDEDGSAFIYILDKGNNRIALISRNLSGGLEWLKSMDFPMNPMFVRAAQGVEPPTGLTKITLDDYNDTGIKSGVYVLDNLGSRVLHIDGCLNSVLEARGSLRGPLLDCSASYGELAIQSWFTTSEGLRLYSTPASIVSLSASPNPFRESLEWTQVTVPVTASGTLVAVVKDGSAVLDTLFNGYVWSGIQYVVWDGTDSLGSQVQSDKSYSIVCTLSAEYGPHGVPYSETKQITVTKASNSHLKALATHDDISDPKWSPDGSQVVFSSQDGSGKRHIRKVDYLTLSETGITSGARDDNYPFWTHGGDSVAYARNLLGTDGFGIWGRENALYLKAASGQGSERLVSDTSGTLGYRQLWDVHPKWIPSENAVSYLRHVGEGASEIHRRRLDSGQDSLDKRFDGTWIDYYSWSPFFDSIGFAGGSVSLYDIYIYHILNDYVTKLTKHDIADSVYCEHGAEWSPDGSKILFVDDWVRLGAWGWEAFTIPSASAQNGGPKVPLGIESKDVMLNSAFAWSPDGTKIVFSVMGATNSELLVADYIRNGADAFPSAYISYPWANSTLGGVVAVRGTAAHNVGVLGTELCPLTRYYVEYGKGDRPALWSGYGVTVACTSGCDIANDTLALWNTGGVEAGLYTIRLVAKGNQDSNVVYQRVNIQHRRLIVKKDGTGGFTTIHAAMDSARAGDTILAYAGDYAEKVVMKEAVHLIGVEDGVRIIGRDSVSLKIENHELPCSVRNVDIRNDNYYSSGTGILISNSSPIITDCLIQNQGSDMSGQPCGIRITGNSKPTFFNCTIRDNKATYGAGLRINAGNEEFPAPSFYGCSFVGNETTGNGGAVYMNYTTPLDTTHAQPYFNGCIFRDNIATTNGSALYLGYCHAPFFTQCTFLNNRPETALGSPIYGYSSGGQFVNCTFKPRSTDKRSV